MRPKLLLLFPLLFAACASGSTQRLPMPDLDVPLQWRGSCRLYLWRDADRSAPETAVGVVDQGFAIGELAAGDFLCWERPPGEVKLELRSGGAGSVGRHGFRVLPGRVYFGRISVAGPSGVPTVTLVPEDRGRLLVADLRPADVEG